MRTCRPHTGVLVAGLAVALFGCGQPPASQGAERGWTARKVGAVKNLAAPESVLVDPETGVAYVANVDLSGQGAWAEDGTGFISRLHPGGKLDVRRWRDSTKAFPLHGPKGMCLADGELYVADVNRVVAFSTKKEARRVVPGTKGKMLNDMAAHGGAVYASETGTGQILKCGEDGVTRIPGPARINGITFADGAMFAVSWTRHEVYEVDPEGQEAPEPFGLAAHLRNPDGIEVLDDGTFLVSDNTGGRIYTIAPDRKTIRVLATVKSPADIGLDRRRNLLYVPQMPENQVTIYKLEKR